MQLYSKSMPDILKLTCLDNSFINLEHLNNLHLVFNIKFPKFPGFSKHEGLKYPRNIKIYSLDISLINIHYSVNMELSDWHLWLWGLQHIQNTGHYNNLFLVFIEAWHLQCRKIYTSTVQVGIIWSSGKALFTSKAFHTVHK